MRVKVDEIYGDIFVKCWGGNRRVGLKLHKFTHTELHHMACPRAELGYFIVTKNIILNTLNLQQK